MSNRQTSSHRGYQITTQCSLVADNRFEASFMICPPTGADDSWQHFVRQSFRTVEAATDDAVRAAKAMVDQVCLGN